MQGETFNAEIALSLYHASFASPTPLWGGLKTIHTSFSLLSQLHLPAKSLLFTSLPVIP